MNLSMVFGIIAAMFAAVSWSLGYIAPFVIGRYTLFDFALVEFTFSGILGLGLLWKNAAAVHKLSAHDWLSACLLGVFGYVGYFLAVMGAAVYAGPVVAPAFLGLVPVVLAIAGNLRERMVSWRVLAAPLTMAGVGLLLVNGSNFRNSGPLPIRSLSIGIPLAILAVALWTVFGLMNQTALAQRPKMDAGVWTALIMVGAGLAMLTFLPFGLLAGVFEIPRLGLGWHSAGPLIAWGAGLAILANVGGAMAWTFASKRLPVALAAQLITMEPVSASVLGLIVHRRWPAPMECLGMVVLLIGVVVAVGIFTRSTLVPRELLPPSRSAS